jgi:choline dehydrogenase
VPDPSVQRFDHVVVGAGAAGCVVAARLSEDSDRTVLLLEAGPADRDPRIWRPASWPQLLGGDLDWGYQTVPQHGLNGRRLAWPRGRVIGGSAAINAMVHVRGAAQDFDAWVEWGGASWGSASVLPWFDRIESTSGSADGGLPVAENTEAHPFAAAFVAAAEKFGLPLFTDPTRADQAGVGFYRTLRDGARRANTASAYLHPALARPNLTVLDQASVLGLEVSGDTVTGVRYRRAGAVHTVRADIEVVLCGGTIASPQLLMVSGIGPAEHLRSLHIPVVLDLPGVGVNLHDHVQVSLSYGTGEAHPVADWSNLGEAGGFVSLGPDSPAPELQLSFAPMRDLNNATEFGRGFTIGPAVTRPRSRGRLTLASADVDVPPLLDPAYLADPADLEVLVEGLRIAHGIAGTAPLSDLRDPAADLRTPRRAELEEFIRDHAQTQFHPVGTCRFGTDDLAVVDPRLRVRGIRGLRVADASVMPAMVTGNIHSAVVVIAERAAAAIREESR